MTAARGFFQNSTYPKDFYRRNGTFGFVNISPDLDALSQAHPIQPGQNNGTGNYVVSTTDQGLKAGVRIVQLFEIIMILTLHLSLALWILHEASQRDASLTLSGSQRAAAQISPGEHHHLLQCPWRPELHSAFPVR